MQEVPINQLPRDRIQGRHLRDVGFLLFISACILAVILQLHVDRTIENIFAVPAVKYSPVIFSFLSLIVFVLTDGVTKIIPKQRVAWLAIFVFFVYALFGSFQTVFLKGGDIEHSYLGRALGIIPFFAACAYLQKSRYTVIFRKTSVFIFSVLALFFAAVAALFFSGKAFQNLPQIFHEEVVLLLIPAMFAPLLAIVFTVRLVIVFSAIGTIFATYAFDEKVTGLMLVLIWAAVVVISWFAYIADGKRYQARVAAMGLRIIVLVAGACAMAYAGFQLYEHRTSLRSTDVRDLSFNMRLDQFVDNPWLGTGFVGSPLMEIGWLEVPSHSDVLDIMAFGGVFAFTLFLIALVSGGVRFLWNWREIWQRSENAVHVSMPVFTGGFLFMMMFNPIIGFPRLSFWFWVAIAFMNSAPILGKEPQTELLRSRRSRRRLA